MKNAQLSLIFLFKLFMDEDKFHRFPSIKMLIIISHDLGQGFKYLDIGLKINKWQDYMKSCKEQLKT